MLGSNTQSTTDGRFANISVNFSQPMNNQLMPQQSSQQQPYQQTQSQSQQQYVSFPNMSAKQMFGADQSQYQQHSQQQEPVWFNNPKKRAIPQTIVRRTTKQTGSTGSQTAGSTQSTTSLSSSSSGMNNNLGFESLTFGSKKSALLFDSQNTQGNILSHKEHNNLMVDSNEAPPTVSLYDWQREDDFGVMISLPTQWGVSGSNNVSDISGFKGHADGSSLFTSSVSQQGNVSNAFDKNQLNGLPFKRALPFDKDSNVNGSSLMNTSAESAVLVFGYPESISNSIITHFSKFGNILEDFQVLRSPSGINASTLRMCSRKLDNGLSGNNITERKYPIFTGDGWVKLTFDSSAPAIRALQENGTVLGGSLIGCVPYTRAAVEQLASCKIEKIDDIGNVNFSLSHSSFGEAKTDSFQTDVQKANAKYSLANTDAKSVFNEGTNHGASREAIDGSNTTYSTRRLDIRDGKSLFVHNANSTNHNFLRSLETKLRHQEEVNLQQQQQQTAGVLHKVNNWLFGWSDL